MKITHIVLGTTMLLATTWQFASTQPVITPITIAQQIIEEVVPLMQLNNITLRNTAYLSALVRDMANLINSVFQKINTINKQQLETSRQYLDTACTNMGDRITSLDLSYGKENPDKDEDNNPYKWMALPAFLKHTKKITNLYLSENDFFAENFKYLENMSQLTRLVLTNTRTGSTQISKLPNLKKTRVQFLSVSGNRLNLTQIVEQLADNGRNLQQLFIANTLTTEQELGLLSSMPNLESLDLSSLKLTKLPDNFAETKKSLEYLELNNNDFTKNGLQPICNLPQLKELSIQSNHMNDFPNITNLKQLQKLRLYGNNFDQATKARIEKEAQKINATISWRR